MSVMYRFLVSGDGKPDKKRAESETGGQDDTFVVQPKQEKPHPALHGSHLQFANILLAAPPIVLLSVVLPSTYTRGSHGNTPAKFLAAVWGFSLMCMGVARVIALSMHLPHLALCVAMHASAHAAFAISKALLQSVADFENSILMPDLTVVAMGLLIGAECFCVWLAGGTVMSSYNPVVFFCNHLLGVIAVDCFRPVLWYLSTLGLVLGP